MHTFFFCGIPYPPAFILQRQDRSTLPNSEMADLSRIDAVKLVNSIRVSNGGIEEKDRRNTPEAVLEALASVKKQLAAATQMYGRISLHYAFQEIASADFFTSLAVELYTKTTRFVFELIQNAEDNNYTVAKRSHKQPFLRFHVTREKIVIDSNEDGFLKENVNAICKVRTSTKKGIRGYIGEKGIGFKSVFTVASVVRVQSGLFCFYFNYGGNDDDGLGLVTPFNCEQETLPPGVRTRFTLTLKDDLDYGNLVKEFTTLPDTLLLFLTKMKTLHVSVHDGDCLYERKYEYHCEEKIGAGLLVKYSQGDKRTDLRFIIRKKEIRNLPSDKARKDMADAKVVLAFPVNNNDTPIIGPQHVCAYLPLRQIDLRVRIPTLFFAVEDFEANVFQFQIQSDFITQASREDILDCDWNRALRDGVAEVFVDAMVHFCENPTLQYLWPRYLPNDAIVDPFWAQLRDLIAFRLEQVPILRTYETGALRCIQDLRIVSKSFLDEGGKPLFEDLEDEVYLSNKYSGEELEILKTIGLKPLAIKHVWDRLEADLNKATSTMKDPQTSASWHSRSAGYLLVCANFQAQALKAMKNFELIPLRDGSWTSINSDAVFHHETHGIEIPVDLGLRILAPEAAANPARKKLFDYLGVTYCDDSYVRKLIVGKYAKWSNVNLASSVSHLRFLFYLSPEDEPIDRTIFLFDAEHNPVYRVRVALGRPEMIVDDLYMDIPGMYNVSSICPKRSGIKSFNIHMINPKYMELEKAATPLHGMSWNTWLEKYGGVLHSPRLIDAHDSKKLSSFFDWIIKRRPNLLLGILKTHWQAYKGLFNDTEKATESTILATLRGVKRRCSNGDDVPLCNTFLPLPELLKLAEELGATEDFRFLQLPSDLPEASLEQWGFLIIFGSGFEQNIDFYLEALRSISSRRTQDQNKDRSTLIKIYEAIEERARVDDHPRLR